MKSTSTAKLLLLIMFLFVCATSFSQRRSITGLLQDSVTLFPIANGIITNSAISKTVNTDANGFFRIEAGVNDILYASAKSYKFDTLRYSLIYTDTITIDLVFAGNVLPAVTVKGQFNRYQLDSIERKTDFDKSRGTVLKTLSNDHPSGFGVTFSLDKVFKKKYRNQRAEEGIFKKLEQLQYINYRFSPNLVAYYTGLRGDRLKLFMQKYAPGYEWLRQNSHNEDVLYYINEKLKDFRSLENKR